MPPDLIGTVVADGAADANVSVTAARNLQAVRAPPWRREAAQNNWHKPGRARRILAASDRLPCGRGRRRQPCQPRPHARDRTLRDLAEGWRTQLQLLARHLGGEAAGRRSGLAGRGAAGRADRLFLGHHAGHPARGGACGALAAAREDGIADLVLPSVAAGYLPAVPPVPMRKNDISCAKECPEFHLHLPVVWNKASPRTLLRTTAAGGENAMSRGAPFSCRAYPSISEPEDAGGTTDVQDDLDRPPFPKLTLIAAILLVTVNRVTHLEQLCAFFYRIRLARPSIPS